MQEGKGEQQGGSNLCVNRSQSRFQEAPLRLSINILIIEVSAVLHRCTATRFWTTAMRTRTIRA